MSSAPIYRDIDAPDDYSGLMVKGINKLRPIIEIKEMIKKDGKKTSHGKRDSFHIKR